MGEGMYVRGEQIDQIDCGFDKSMILSTIYYLV